MTEKISQYSTSTQKTHSVQKGYIYLGYYLKFGNYGKRKTSFIRWHMPHRLYEIAENRFPDSNDKPDRLSLMLSSVHVYKIITCEELIRA
jgi:hypothetical protein